MDERAPGMPDFGPATDDPRRDFDPEEYVFRSHIGSGAMGDVLEALDVRLRRIVAIKRSKNLELDPVELERARERMRLEGEVLAKKQHPNLLSVYTAGITRSGCPFLVTERLHGRTLGAVIRERGFLPVAEALPIARSILAGLGFVHPEIVHRDVKPDNIFITDSEVPKLLDFGLAKVLAVSRDPNAPAPLSVATATGTALGSPRFMAPEQCTGDKTIDHRADVYGVGTTLYVMLTGVAPFDEFRLVHEILYAHVHKAPLPPSHFARQMISPELDRCVLKAIAKRPSDRFSSAQEFAVELLRIEAQLSKQAGVAPVGRRSTELMTGAPTARSVVTRKGTSIMNDDEAVRAAGEEFRKSLGGAPPPTYAPTTELPRIEPTTELPSPPLQTKPGGDSRVDATLVSRPSANGEEMKRRRQLLVIVTLILILGILTTLILWRSL